MLLGWITVFNLSSISLAITMVALLIANHYRKARSIPHGPTGLPIFGYWPFLRQKTAYLQLDALKEKYGDYFFFTIAGQKYVNLGSYKVLREVQVAQAGNFERFQDFCVINCVFRGGVGYMNGEKWKIFRKFFSQTVKRRGLLALKESMDASMYELINSTIESLKGMRAEPVDITQLVMGKCTNVFRETMFGEHISEERMKEINKRFGDILNSGIASKRLKLALLYEVINEHKSTYDEEVIRDVVDEYIKERNDRRNKGDPTVHYFNDRILMSSLVEILGDGGFTVGVHIALSLKMLLKHPEKQEKMYREILEVVGLERQPTIEDKSQLPYTSAFILEVLRTSEFFPFFPSLECKKDTIVRGVTIPKGTITVVNKWSAHHDPEEFDEPEKFNPSRFITTEEDKRPELPLTFGIGKRACIGEGFAMAQVFLFVAAIITNFHISLVGTSEDNSYAYFLNGKFRIRVQPRSHSE